MTTRSMLSRVQLELTFQAETDLFLPQFKGSTFRGMFKTALQQISCRGYSPRWCFSGTKGKILPRCVHTSHCAYAEVAAPSTDTGATLPLPYIFSCANLHNQLFSKGERFSFFLTLFGSSVIEKHLETVTRSFSKWGELDIGRFKYLLSAQETLFAGNRRPWQDIPQTHGAMRLVAVTRHPVTDKEARQSSAHTIEDKFGLWQFMPPSFTDSLVDATESWRVKIQFVAPLRLPEFKKLFPERERKKNLPLVPAEIDFPVFFKALSSRLRLLAESHEGFAVAKDDPYMIMVNKAAAKVQGGGSTGHLVVKEIKRLPPSSGVSGKGLRTKQTQGTKSKTWEWADGVLGEIEFNRVETILLPWLAAGQNIHVGKNTAYGYGQYKMEIQK